MVSAKFDTNTPDLFEWSAARSKPPSPLSELVSPSRLPELQGPTPICREIGIWESKSSHPHLASRNALDLQLHTGGSVARLTAQVLGARGHSPGKEFDRYIDSRYSDLPNIHDVEGYFELRKTIQQLYEVLVDAKKTGKKIALVNDFDADGFTSTALFKDFLRSAGIESEVFETRRSDLARGLTTALADRIVDADANILITFDIGTENGAQFAHAKERAAKREGEKAKLTTIVLDHHDVRADLASPADIFINLCRPGWELGGAIYATAGLSFLVSKWLSEIPAKDSPFRRVNIKNLLDLSFIGTVCDMMDLVGDNRLIARLGTKVLTNTTRPGLQSLIKLLKLSSPITAEHVGIFIGPCLNAAGRLNKIDIVIEFLTTRSHSRAEELAAALFKINKDRRELQATIKEEMKKGLTPETLAAPALVLFLEKYVENGIGVVGLVAGGFGEEYLIPSFVSARDSNGNFTGSARGIRDDLNVHAVYAAPDVRPLLISGGGHNAVGGHVIAPHNRDPLREGILKNVGEQTKGLPPIRTIDWDVQVHLSQLDYMAIKNLEKFIGPFGKANPAPRFLIRGLVVESVEMWRSEHTSLFVHHASSGSFAAASASAVLWHNPSHPALVPNAVVDVVCQAAIKPFRGAKSTVRLDLLAVMESDAATKEAAHVTFTDRRVMHQDALRLGDALQDIHILEQRAPLSEEEAKKLIVNPKLISPKKIRQVNRKKRPDGSDQETLEYSKAPEADEKVTASAEGFDIAKREAENPNSRVPSLAELMKRYDLSALEGESIKETAERMKLLQFFLKNIHTNLVFQSPTGSGKTYIFLLLVAAVMSVDASATPLRGRVLIVTPQVELTDQIKRDAAKVLKLSPVVEKFESESKDADLDLEKEQENRIEPIMSLSGDLSKVERIPLYPDTEVRAFVATPQVIHNDIVKDGLYSLAQFDLVVFDEAQHINGQSSMAQVAREAAPRTRIVACSAQPAGSPEALFELTHTLDNAVFVILEGDRKRVVEEIFEVEYDAKTEEALGHLRNLARVIAQDAFIAFKDIPEFKKKLHKTLVVGGGKVPGAYGVLALIEDLSTREFSDEAAKRGLFVLKDLYQALYLYEQLACHGKFAFLHAASKRLWNFRVESIANEKQPNLRWKRVSGSLELNNAFEVLSEGTPFHRLAFLSDGGDISVLLKSYERNKKAAFDQFIAEGQKFLVEREEPDSLKLAQLEENIENCLACMPTRQHLVFAELNIVTDFIEARLNHRLKEVAIGVREYDEHIPQRTQAFVALRFVGKGHITGEERKQNLQKLRNHQASILTATAAAAEGHHIPGLAFGHIFNPASNPRLAIQKAGRIGRAGSGVMAIYYTKGSLEELRHWRCKANIRRLNKMKKYKAELPLE